jgi:ACR3 family arsenite efflux pump ArsB
VIFQIGLLSFFIATVVFGIQGYSLIDLVTRSFLVFIGVLVALTAIFAAGVFFARQTATLRKEEQRQAPGKQPQSQAS